MCVCVCLSVSIYFSVAAAVYEGFIHVGPQICDFVDTARMALAGCWVDRRQAEGFLTEGSDIECSWQLWNRPHETSHDALIANWHINMYCVCRCNYIQGSVYYYKYQHLAQIIWGSLAGTQPWISI